MKLVEREKILQEKNPGRFAAGSAIYPRQVFGSSPRLGGFVPGHTSSQGQSTTLLTTLSLTHSPLPPSSQKLRLFFY